MTVVVLLAAATALVAALFRPAGIALPDVARVRVEQGLTDVLPGGAQLTIEGASLQLAGDGRPVVVLRDLTLSDAEDRPLARLPKASVALHRRALATGRLAPDRITAEGLEVTLDRDANGVFQLGFGTFGATPPLTEIADVIRLIEAALDTPGLVALSDLSLGDVTFVMRDARAGRSFKLENGRARLKRTDDGLSMGVDVALAQPDRLRPYSQETENWRPEDRQAVSAGLQPGSASVQLDVQHGRLDAALAVTVRNLPPALLGAQVPGLEALRHTSTPVSLRLRGALDDAGRLGRVAGSLDLGEGRLDLDGHGGMALDSGKAYVVFDPTLDRLQIQQFALEGPQFGVLAEGTLDFLWGQTPGLPDVVAQLRARDVFTQARTILAAPVTVDEVQVDLRLSPDAQRLQIGQLRARMGSLELQGDADLRLEEGGIRGPVNIRVPHGSIDEVTALWPLRFGPRTRSWLSRNLTEAQLSDFSLALRFAPDQLDPTFGLFAAFADARLQFLPEMPALTQARGVFSINGNQFDLAVHEGKIDTGAGLLRADGSAFKVPHMRGSDMGWAEVDLALEGPLPGLLSVLARDPVNLSLDQMPIVGVSQMQARIRFPTGRPPEPGEVTWRANGTLSGVAADALFKGRSLRAQTLSVEATPESLAVSGTVRIDDVPAQLSLIRDLGPDAPPGVAVTGTLAVSQDNLAKLGVQLGGITAQGEAPAQFTLTILPGQPSRLALSSDLRGLRLGLPALGWGKSADQSGDLALSLTLGETVTVDQLDISAPGLVASGTLSTDATGGLQRAVFETFQLGNWLSVRVELEGRGAGRGPSIALTGGRMDLRGLQQAFGPVAAGGGGDGAGTGGRGFAPIRFALESVVVSEKLRLTNVSGRMAEGQALDIQFQGRVNGGAAISGVVVRPQGQLAARIRAADAGEVLSSMRILQTGRGGELDLVLQAQDGQAGVWAGQLNINNLVITQAPVLAELLSAVSVVGLIEQMTTGGIVMSETTVGLTLTPDGLILRDGRAAGPSMGITFAGAVRPAAGVLDISGVISPLYMVNAIGGAFFARRGEGLFGINYTMSGQMASPTVSVNPLSILTPGVFRDLFRTEPPTQ